MRKSEGFRIDTGMHHVPLHVQCIYGKSDVGEDGDGKEERNSWNGSV